MLFFLENSSDDIIPDTDNEVDKFDSPFSLDPIKESNLVDRPIENNLNFDVRPRTNIDDKSTELLIPFLVVFGLFYQLKI